MMEYQENSYPLTTPFLQAIRALPIFFVVAGAPVQENKPMVGAAAAQVDFYRVALLCHQVNLSVYHLDTAALEAQMPMTALVILLTFL